jgi:4-amino-4-deoxychorismate lyase
MSLLLESIKLLDGQFENLFQHEQRMNRSLKMLCGTTGDFDLEKLLDKIDRPRRGLFKCRITYDDITSDIEFIPYVPKVIQTLRAIENDRITYNFKYVDRKPIEKMFEARNGSDDILIIKGGVVTDSSYANVVFRRGKRWLTPWSPLLKGTMRAFLLEREIIAEEEIRVEDIDMYEGFKLVNAMIGFDGPEQPISNIIF